MLDDRRSAILEALVEEYIATGTPVSSQTVLERTGLAVSSATIRNDLARLESYGFVIQPHTSAGRIPTSQGFRYYVDHAPPTKLKLTTRTKIDSFFGNVHQELNRLLKETSGMLSDVSHYPAIVIGPGFSGESIRALHLVSLSESVLLAVSVSGSGRVSQDVVRLAAPPRPDDLADAEQFVIDAFEGHTIPEGLTNVAALPKDSIRPEVRTILLSVAKALRGVDRTTKEIYVGGTAQLAQLWQDLAHVHAILTLLEQEPVIRRMLDDDSEHTTVRLAAELDISDLDLAIISSPYDAGDHGTGRVGVLGPMRMDYRRTMRIVEEVGDSLGDSLGGA